MSWLNIFAIYFILWWLCLFVVLPWGVRTQADVGEIVEGSAPSAPHKLRMVRTLIATTIVAAIVFAGLVLIVRSKLITLDDIPIGFGW